MDPSFRLVTNDFGNLKRFGFQAIHPAFGDLNGDGRVDVVFGLADGTLHECLNRAVPGDLPDFDEPETISGVDVGDYATPQLFDLDRDGHLDLLIGNRRGRISYYRNVSTSDISDFQFVTDTLGGVDVRNADVSFFGHCVPCFYRDGDQQTVLFCGGEQGNLCCYSQIDNNLSGRFCLGEDAVVEGEGSEVCSIVEGLRSAPALADLNADGFVDMIVGNYAGGLTLFMGTLPPPIAVEDVAKPLLIKVFPNPASDCFYLEMNELQGARMAIYDLSGRLVHTEPVHAGLTKINVGNWPAGIYVGTVFSDRKMDRFKLVVNH